MSNNNKYTGKERRSDRKSDDDFMLGQMHEAIKKMSNEDIPNIYAELTGQGKTIARLEVKSGIFGAIGGALVAIPPVGYIVAKWLASTKGVH